MRRLRAIGLNSLYTEVWKQRFTGFPSQTTQNTIGFSSGTNPSPGIAVQQCDLLSETLIQASRNQRTNIAWFEYDQALRFGNSTNSPTDLIKRMVDRGWLLKDSAGNFTDASIGFSRVNPLVPEVRTFIKNVLLDAVRNYDLYGIQFYDRLAWPLQFGYDDCTRNVYRQRTCRTHRPPARLAARPVVAARVSRTSTWNVTFPTDGRYRVVQRVGDTWT